MTLQSLGRWGRRGRALAPRTGLFVLLALVVLGAAPLEAQGQGPTLHVLFAVDTDDVRIGVAVAKDLKMMKGLFKALPDAKLEFVELIDAQLSSSSVLAHLNGLKGRCGKDDAVFVYYSGHGAYDPDQGHYFSISRQDKLARWRVRRALDALPVRLKVLMSDCCASRGELPGAKDRPDRPIPRAQDDRDAGPTLRELFLKSSGTVDFNGSLIGQISACTASEGSTFSLVFCEFCYRTPPELDLDKNKVLTWRELFPQTIAPTQKYFADVYADGFENEAVTDGRQFVQTPQAYCLPAYDPKRDPPPPFRIGMAVEQREGPGGVPAPGVTVVRVAPDGPAASAGVLKGDVVLSFNKVLLFHSLELDALVDHCEGQAVLVVSREGQVLTLPEVALERR